MFKTLAHFKAVNAETGRHFFERGAMKFFKSRIESGLIAGRYFITSEQFDENSQRKFSVRRAEEDGSVKTVPEFQAFSSIEDARDYIKTVKASK
jgi:hypothetical protein